MSRKKIFTPLLLLAFILLASNAAMACTCEIVVSDKDAVKIAVKYSAVVFRGTVISKTITSDLSVYGAKVSGDTSTERYRSRNYPMAVVKIKATVIFKGATASDTLIILTPRNEAACGYLFEVGGDYIVYGTEQDEVFAVASGMQRSAKNGKTYFTNMCTLTSEWSQTEEAEIIKAQK